jgi:hypothetical protein
LRIQELRIGHDGVQILAIGATCVQVMMSTSMHEIRIQISKEQRHAMNDCQHTPPLSKCSIHREHNGRTVVHTPVRVVDECHVLCVAKLSEWIQGSV